MDLFEEGFCVMEGSVKRIHQDGFSVVNGLMTLNNSGVGLNGVLLRWLLTK